MKALILILFPIFSFIYYAFSFSTHDFYPLFLTISTFLFGIFAGFFIARQGNRYSQIREKIAAFRDELGRAVAYITSPAFAVDTVARTERKVETAKALDIVRGLKIPETARLKTTFQLVHQDLMREEDRGGRVFDLYNLVNENIRMSVESSLAAERANIGLLESIVQAAA